MTADPIITVMTLNLWGGQQWLHRRDAVAAWVEQIRPDLLALQEVVRTPDHCQATWLADRTGMTAVFSPAHERTDFEFGNAVLTRLPITATRSTSLTAGAGARVGERRGAVTVEVQSGHGSVAFTSTHLAHLFDEGWLRQAQVLDLADFVQLGSHNDFPPIVCGDFNARPDSTEVRFVKGLHAIDGRSFHLFDAFEVANPNVSGFTWDNRNPNAALNQVPDQRIDYVFVGVRTNDGAGRVITAKIVCDQPHDGVWASDHFGVAVELACPPTA